MGSFDSQICSIKIQGSPMREFSVPDESGSRNFSEQRNSQHQPFFDEQSMNDFQSRSPSNNDLEVEKQFADAKRAKREGKERLSDGAKRRIEMLIGMTKLTRDVDINGNLFRLKTLTSKELREAIVNSSEFNGNIGFVFETRKQILARSIVVVAGVDVDQFLGSTQTQAKLDFIEEMDHSLLVRLYNEYNLLAQEAETKYSPKSEEEIKEVLQDLKK